MDKFAMIIFGASGDLTKRKLMPALYSLYRDKRLTGRFLYTRHRAYDILRRELSFLYIGRTATIRQGRRTGYYSYVFFCLSPVLLAAGPCKGRRLPLTPPTSGEIN